MDNAAPQHILQAFRGAALPETATAGERAAALFAYRTHTVAAGLRVILRALAHDALAVELETSPPIFDKPQADDLLRLSVVLVEDLADASADFDLRLLDACQAADRKPRSSRQAAAPAPSA